MIHPLASSSLRRTAACVALLSVLGLRPLAAQQSSGEAPANKERSPALGEEEPLKLSPFVVNASQDNGYQATSTLAGTRLNTPVKDLGASISIYTKDFLQDLGATSANDLLI